MSSISNALRASSSSVKLPMMAEGMLRVRQMGTLAKPILFRQENPNSPLHLSANRFKYHSSNGPSSDAIQFVRASEVGEACSQFIHAYIREGDNKAGYDLLWLIKEAAGCVYDIPENDSFNHETVTKILSKFIGCLMANENELLEDAPIFLEILYHPSSIGEFLFERLLDSFSNTLFINFTLRQLKNIPMDQWPDKTRIIRLLLEDKDCKLTVARALAASNDPTTSEIGNHLLDAFTANSFNEAIPHFEALEKLVPCFQEMFFEQVFGRHFIKFSKKDIEDPEFTTRLNFNEMRKVFVQDSLMIGVYETNMVFGHKRVAPHLLAFDMNTQKMVWGMALTSKKGTFLDMNERPNYILNRVGEYISLQFLGQKTMHIIHPKTGEFHFSLDLPIASKEDHDSVHISPQGFAYQYVERKLMGGKIVDKTWKSSFESKSSPGSFRPLSTHCAFQPVFSTHKFVLFGPTGDQVILENCLEAIAQDDKLYAIEKDPTNKDKCLLTVRTLKTDSEVVSKVEKTISLNVNKAFFGALCKNGQMILFAGNTYNTAPFFVDLVTQEVNYIKQKFPDYSERIFNSDTAELWTWDVESEKIWKVSSTEIKLMGSLKGRSGMTLLHVDNKDHLFFM